MDLKVSLESENGLLNFLKKIIKKNFFFGYRHKAPSGARLQSKVFHCKISLEKKTLIQNH
jgi:hypothetical protein